MRKSLIITVVIALLCLCGCEAVVTVPDSPEPTKASEMLLTTTAAEESTDMYRSLKRTGRKKSSMKEQQREPTLFGLPAGSVMTSARCMVGHSQRIRESEAKHDESKCHDRKV